MRKLLFYIILIIVVCSKSLGTEPNWTYIPGTYENTMSVTGLVIYNGSASNNANDLVGAFVGETCRGVATMTDCGPYGMLAFLTVAGEGDEEIEFKVYHASSDQIFSDFSTLTFTIDASNGDIINPYEWDIIADEVPLNVLLDTDSTFWSGTSTCIDAENTITVAGNNNTVVVENNADVSLIAGQSIRFLPGFTAESGSYVSASITTNGSYCTAHPTDPDQKEMVMEKSTNIDPAESSQNNQPSFKVYPNPNNGFFLIHTEGLTGQVKIEIYNCIGGCVYKNSTTTQSIIQVDLSIKNKGMYLVYIHSTTGTFIQKVIID